MKKFVIIAVFLMLAIMTVACFAGINIPYLSGAITIDGQDNDPGWIGQPVNSYDKAYLFLDNRIDPNQVIGMTCRFGRNGQYFYYNIAVKDPQIVTKPWTQWRRSDICIVCLANGATERVALIMPNAQMRMMTPGSDVLNTTTGTMAIRILSGGYAVEGSIPLVELGGVPADGKIKLAVVQRDWNQGQNDYSAIGSTPNAVCVVDGQNLWEDATIATTPTIPVVSAKAFKSFTEGVTFRVDQLLWNVTFADENRFICEEPVKRIQRQEVLFSGANRPAQKDIVLSVTGRMVAGKLQADAVEFMHGYGKAFPVKPWGVNSRAICAINTNLLVRLTGKVKQSFAGGFVIRDGGKDTRVLWSTLLENGITVSVNAVASSDADGTILLATDVASEWGTTE